MDSSTFSIEEISSVNSDSAVSNNSDEYYQQSKKRSELSDENELSTESSEEFEVIKEKAKSVEEVKSKRCSVAEMQNKFLTNTLEQSWISTDNASDKFIKSADSIANKNSVIRRRSIKNEMCISQKDSVKDEERNLIGDDAPAENYNKQLTVKNCSALIIITIVSIIISSVIIPICRSRFSQDEKTIPAIKLRDAIIAQQKRTIEEFRTAVENAQTVSSPGGSDSLKVAIDEERSGAFERRSGYDYRLVIVEWRKEVNENGHMSRQHLRLSVKQCNGSSIFVYDHGPISGKLFSVGDRFIDVDGKRFTAITELRDHILWSFNKRDLFTAIIERPVSEQALLDVKECLKPNSSSFSIIISTRT